MASFGETLVGIAPRESSGGPSSNRHQFHRTWALCHLLRLHERTGPYVLVLEYHDDVVVLDSEVDPQTGEFFQVKTKRSGRWTRKQLIAIEKHLRDGSGPRSVLGKLMDHGMRFGPNVLSLTIVSNAAFDLEVETAPPSVDRERVLVSELSAVEAESLRTAVKAELQCSDDLPWDKVSFWATGISLIEHETYGIGQLAKFLEQHKPKCRVPVPPLFRTLRDELGRRGDTEHKPSSLAELCQMKGIRRADFDAFLKAAEETDPELSLNDLRSELVSEGFQYRERNELVDAWRRYSAERTDRANAVVQEFRSKVEAVVATVCETAEWNTLSEFLSAAIEAYARQHGAPTTPFDAKYLRGAALFELKTFEARQHSSTHSEPPSQTA